MGVEGKKKNAITFFFLLLTSRAMPGPVAIAKQKAAYEKKLDEELKKGLTS